MIVSAFGAHAADLIATGEFGRTIACENRYVVDVPLGELVAPPPVDPDSMLVLGLCLGDG
jgi:ATP-dependent phosphofructokinase / diphosphate-dependent phosphofructokinase